MSLGVNVYLQLIVKHLLTQGDSMILAAFSSLEDQGFYALVSNYGGLLARVIFQPLEESSRNLFARLVNANGKGETQRRGIDAAKSHLAGILRLYGIMSILAFILGPTVVPEILDTLLGSRWMKPKVKSLLGVYCYYIPFLAFNGITEAFVASTADSAEIRMQAAWMAVFSTCYAVMCFIFLHIGALGAYGLVLANIVNMLVRTLWSYTFIRRYLRRQGTDLQLVEVSPRLLTFGFCVIAISLLSASKPSTDDWTEKIKILGVALFCSLLMCVLRAWYFVSPLMILSLFAERRYLIQQGQTIFKQIKAVGRD
jgi:oligosaccharide translocation protein RFT1